MNLNDPYNFDNVIDRRGTAKWVRFACPQATQTAAPARVSRALQAR
jgi:hypothetical protein